MYCLHYYKMSDQINTLFSRSSDKTLREAVKIEKKVWNFPQKKIPHFFFLFLLPGISKHTLILSKVKNRLHFLEHKILLLLKRLGVRMHSLNVKLIQSPSSVLHIMYISVLTLIVDISDDDRVTVSCITLSPTTRPLFKGIISNFSLLSLGRISRWSARLWSSVSSPWTATTVTSWWQAVSIKSPDCSSNHPL